MKPIPYNEAFAPDGTLSPGWRYVMESLEALGTPALLEREEKAKRILRDDGATYNVYSGNTSAGRVWELDLVPAVVTSGDWAKIEAGLLERAELFNLILKDLYGPRELLRAGIIPPDLIFSHRGFLRPCHGISLPGVHELIIHAVDMVRDATGELTVLVDRTQAPSGAGYALENRTVMSRVLPSMFRESHVHRLAHFFHRLRTKLASLAPNQDEPRVVVLTPGAYNETFFEHAFLANYLGYPLVQSGDLMVNNGFVWMKSLDGLTRVDVILRRVDDWFCDPLELKSDSQLGVPGILEVARLGRVAIANPLGSGVLENPALFKYLPQIGRKLLGREPRLASVRTYWCGEPNDLAFVLAHLPELVIKAIYRGADFRTQIGAELTREQLATLSLKIQASPSMFVAQELLTPACMPVLLDDVLVPRPAVLRSFAVASDASYVVMPGGLTRVGREEGARIITNQTGSLNKDTWIVASEAPKQEGANAATDVRPLAAAHMGSLPSRVVENLFWFGRYAERAESALRLLRTAFVLLNGADVLPAKCRLSLLQAVTRVTTCYPGFCGGDTELLENPEQELLAVILDGERFGSLSSSLNALLVCSEETKELLSSDTLRIINDLRDGLVQLQVSLKGGLAAAPEEALDPLVTTLLALSGLLHESMIRGVGWRFMQLGRRLERALQTTSLVSSLLAHALPEEEEAVLLQTMLLTLEVLITYRRRYRGRMEVVHGLELVLIDTTNPRSLLFQLEQLQKLVDELPPMGIASRELLPEQRIILDGVTRLRLTRLIDLVAADEQQMRRQLTTALHEQHQILQALGGVLSDKYFDHRTGPQQLVPANREGE